jgi:hypothetical protein
MRTWRWLDLGAVDGPTMVNLFVALAPSVGSGETSPTVVVLHPRAPFANVGFHQEADRELDLDHCRKQGIPVVRRVVGGGAILDGPWEQDYMLLVPAGTPGTEHGVEAFYERFLRPIGGALVRLGVHAERSGVNDLAVGGRKISANGAMLLDGCWVLVGDILLDLDLPASDRRPDSPYHGKGSSTPSGKSSNGTWGSPSPPGGWKTRNGNGWSGSDKSGPRTPGPSRRRPRIRRSGLEGRVPDARSRSPMGSPSGAWTARPGSCSG